MACSTAGEQGLQGTSKLRLHLHCGGSKLAMQELQCRTSSGLLGAPVQALVLLVTQGKNRLGTEGF